MTPEQVHESPRDWVRRHIREYVETEGRKGHRWSSVGGARSHPSWYLNLRADSEVHVQVGAERFDARARTASARERSRLWRIMTSIWPEYDRYRARIEREIPVVVIERAR